jgi:hypothetical protein
MLRTSLFAPYDALALLDKLFGLAMLDTLIMTGHSMDVLMKN